MARKLLIAFRWGIFLLACGFLWRHLDAVKGRDALEALRTLGGTSRGLLLLGCVVLLMPVNWCLEAWKWRLLVGPLERMPLSRAFAATIAGTSVALVTPNRMGEFLGRVLFLESGHRVAGAFATALGSIAQFVVTLVAGGIGFGAIVATRSTLPWGPAWASTAVASLIALVTAGALLLYLRPRLLRQLLLVFPLLERLDRASAVLDRQQPALLRHVLLLSTVRYAVFALQYVLLLHLLGSGTSTADLVMAVPCIYLLSTLVPTILLTELGVRGSTALAVLLPMGAGELPVLLATTLVWSINVVLPAMAGSILLLVAHIRTDRTDP